VLINWADADEMRGASAAFVLANSVAGLLPRMSGLQQLPDAFMYWVPTALTGAWIGTELRDATRLRILKHTRLLSLVPILAGMKLVL